MTRKTRANGANLRSARPSICAFRSIPLPLRVLSCAMVLLLATPALAQSVTVTADRTSIGLGETLRLRIVMQGRFDDANGPDLSDFDVVGKSTGTSISVIGGVVQQEQRVDLTLAPRRAGRLRIGPVELLSGGRVVASSQPVWVVVSERVAPPTPPPPSPSPSPAQEEAESVASPRAPQALPDQVAGRAAFLWVRVPDRTMYVGEPIFVEYVLFVRSGLPVQGARTEAMPEFKGFVVDPAPVAEERGTRVRVRGVWYDTFVQWRGAVTALGPGPATLDPMSVVLVAGDLFSQRRYRVTSEPVTVTFQDLPSEGRPADFTIGTVGAFVMKASLDRDHLRVGDSAVLSIQVSGSGNLRALKPPSLTLPEGLGVARVPSSDLDERVVDAGGVSGRRVFQYLLTGNREGEYTIPRLDLAFFNPMTGRYERTRTDPLRLVVMGTTPGGPIREVRTPQERVVEILAKPDLSPAANATPFSPSVSWIGGGMGIPVFLLLGVEAALRYRQWSARNLASQRRRRALSESLRSLRRLSREPPGDPREFWAALDRVIREFLWARFEVSTNLSHEDVRSALLARTAPVDAVDALLAEMDACAFGRFAPSAIQDMDRTASLDRVRACLQTLDRVRDGRH